MDWYGRHRALIAAINIAAALAFAVWVLATR
jgi:hypothetical protein